ncbi:hypothetical protein Dimus_011333, partial [Dionaea muscipula]
MGIQVELCGLGKEEGIGLGDTSILAFIERSIRFGYLLLHTRIHGAAICWSASLCSTGDIWQSLLLNLATGGYGRNMRPWRLRKMGMEEFGSGEDGLESFLEANSQGSDEIVNPNLVGESVSSEQEAAKELPAGSSARHVGDSVEMLMRSEEVLER